MTDPELNQEQIDQQRRQYENSIRLARAQVQATAIAQIAANAAQNSQTSAEAAARVADIIQNARSRKGDKK